MSERGAEIKALKDEIEGLRTELEKAVAREKDYGDARSAMLFLIEDMDETAAAVTKAKNEWETTFDSISDPIFIHDLDMRVLRCNRAYMEEAGVAFSGIIGKRYHEVFPKTLAPLEICKRCVAGAQDSNAASFQAPEDEFALPGRVYNLKVYPLKTDGAESFIHVMEDITGRKRAEERIKEESEVTRRLLMIAGATAKTMDLDSMMEGAAECVRNITASDAVLSYLWDSSAGVLRPCRSSGLRGADIPAFMTMTIKGEEDSVRAAFSSEGPLIEEAGECPGSRGSPLAASWSRFRP